jgi:hypothetical protein
MSEDDELDVLSKLVIPLPRIVGSILQLQHQQQQTPFFRAHGSSTPLQHQSHRLIFVPDKAKMALDQTKIHLYQRHDLPLGVLSDAIKSTNGRKEACSVY